MSQLKRVSFFSRDRASKTPAVSVSMDAERASGAAKRRRERRSGAILRHERQTVANGARSGVRPDATHVALRGQTLLSSEGRRLPLAWFSALAVLLNMVEFGLRVCLMLALP